MSRLWRLQGFAYASMAIYTVGIPLFFWAILYHNHRKLVLQTPRCQSRYGFLYSKYEDRAWCVELLTLRKAGVACMLRAFPLLRTGHGHRSTLLARDVGRYRTCERLLPNMAGTGS